MCLYTKHKKPLVAKRRIRVFKHVSTYSLEDKTAKSPCQGTLFKLDEEFLPARGTVDIRGTSLCEINGGVIHACLWPDFSRGACLEAYIPEGTEYWIGVDHTTICARKLVVLSKPITPADCAGVDPIMAEMLYDSAEEHHGVKIGDYLVTNENGEDTYYKPTQLSNVPKDKIKGMVVGFNGSTPEIADIFNIVNNVMIDSDWNSKLDKYFDEGDNAQKDMDGYKHTLAWKSTCDQDKRRFEAYHAIKSKGEDYYIPALGEMKLLLDNILTVAASCSLAGFSCPISMGDYFWSSTESSQYVCWCCGIYADGWCRYWDDRSHHHGVVPFVASQQMKKKNVE